MTSPEEGEASCRVLLLEAGKDLLGHAADELGKLGCKQYKVHSATEARACLNRESIDVVVISLCESAALSSTLLEIRGRSNRPPAIAIIEDYSVSTVIDLLRTVDTVLPAPPKKGSLERAIRWLFRRDQDGLALFAGQYRLSVQETRLLQCALAGLNNDEAAEELACTRATVATYWNRIFRKTGVSGQRDVVVLFMRTLQRIGALLGVPEGPMSAVWAAREEGGFGRGFGAFGLS